MFNVEPPSTISSDEPSQDITFGVDNPSYVAMMEITADNLNKEEIIDINEDKTPEETKTEDELTLDENISQEDPNKMDITVTDDNHTAADDQTLCTEETSPDSNTSANELLDIFDDNKNNPELEGNKI